MKKNLLLVYLLLIPVLVNAVGLGIHSTYTAMEHDTYGDIYYDNPSPGIGLTFDTNIGKDELFSYRVSAEFVNDTKFTVDGYDFEKSSTSLIHTFGFGFYRNKVIRLWVGPRLNLQTGRVESNDFYYYQDRWSLGAGVATGININFGKVAALAFDIDYQWNNLNIVETADIGGQRYMHHDDGLNTSMTYRVYVLFKFGERFIPKSNKLDISDVSTNEVDTGPSNIEIKLNKLKDLYDRGVLSEDEYQNIRKKTIEQHYL